MPVLRGEPAHHSWASNEVNDDMVDLYKKRFCHKTIAAFSSEEDQEDDAQDETEEQEEENPEDEDKPDPSTLTDDDLKAALLVHGVKAGPIVGTTRSLYERKLRRLQAGRQEPSKTEIILLCSDSEEDNEAGCNGPEEQESSQNGRYGYPQCFLPSSKLCPVTYVSRHSEAKQSVGKVTKSSMPSVPTANGMNAASTSHQRSGLETKVVAESIQTSTLPSRKFSIIQMVEEMESRKSDVNESEVHEHRSPANSSDTMSAMDERRRSQYYTPMVSPYKRKEKDPVNDAFKDIKTTPIVINATCRRPIKGAARRPIRFTYPQTPVSPTTQERREVQRRLVPMQIQFAVFIFIAVLLFIVDDGPLTPTLARIYKLMLNFGSEGASAVSGQD
uniref:lamina-associated polypeptide 2, isoforms beta/gamma-like isoform X2 n=1 Tax=Doryrhamphus excisus TaxID=161450 RepID=UPI0025AE8777|nr:lamina-associated polypeptide 2, isoforms beta/gamma-like isoform X2 [Doryrhamphus excisus]